MKRQGSTTEIITNAVLATRYLALQKLRERVRRAEQCSASKRLKKVLIPQRAPRRDDHVEPKSCKS